MASLCHNGKCPERTSTQSEVAQRLVRINRWWNSIDDWLDAADPGAVRRRQATRAALAALMAWLIARTVVGWLAGRPLPAVGLYAVTICFISALIIVDARRADRQITQVLSIAIAAVALLLTSLLGGTGTLHTAVLLALIFASYAARQFGLRPGELVLMLTMSFYFASGIGVTGGNLAWYLFAVVVGVGSLWLWQFVLLPYDPRRSLRNSVAAFFRRAATVIDAVDAGLTAAPADEAGTAKDLTRRLRQVKLCRRVIEEQFPGALAPGGWTKAQLAQLQLGPFQHRTGVGADRRGRQPTVAPDQHPGRDSDAARAQLALAAGSAHRWQPGKRAGVGCGRRCVTNRSAGLCERGARRRTRGHRHAAPSSGSGRRPSTGPG